MAHITYQQFLESYVHNFMHGAEVQEQRIGQWWMNCMPGPIYMAVGGTSFDPFYTITNKDELYDWLDNHIIFNDRGNIIGVFDGEEIIWEADDPDMGVPAMVRS